MNTIKNFLSTKKGKIITISVVVFIVILALILRPNPPSYVTEVAASQTVRRTVLATGQVTSTTDLSLSFVASDVIRSIRVSVGDRVTKGQILATLEQGNQLASLTQAQGSLLAAEARYQKLIEGATDQEIRIAQTALQNARRDLENTIAQQRTAVSNAYTTLLNSGLQAQALSGSSSLASAPIITGTYTGEMGEYRITTYASSSGGFFSTSGIESVTGPVNTTAPTPLGTKGLFIQFPNGFVSNTSTTWIVSIPNTQSATYVQALNAYTAAQQTQRSAVASAEALVATREAELALRTAEARSADVQLAEADVLAARGQVQAATAALERTILRAPASGTITRINPKVGEQAQALQEAMVLQDVENLYVEANINEANIAYVSIGQPVTITYDALGPSQLFTGTVLSIDPGSTVISGVVNYRVKVALAERASVRPGMTANMIIETAALPDVIAVPTRAILEEEGQRVIRVLTNDAIVRTPVTVLLEGDEGISAVTGIEAGATIVVLEQKR